MAASVSAVNPISILLVLGLTAGVIYLLLRRGSRGPSEPRAVGLCTVADAVHGEPCMLVGDVTPEEGQVLVEAPFGGGEVLYHVTRLERIKDAPDMPTKEASGASKEGAPAGLLASVPGIAGVVGGLVGGGVDAPAVPAATPAEPPPGTRAGVVALAHEGVESWLLRDDSGTARVHPFVSERQPALRLSGESLRVLQKVPLGQVEAFLVAAGKKVDEIPGLAGDSDDDDTPLLSGDFLVKQEVLHVGERVLVAGRCRHSGEEDAEHLDSSEAARRDGARRQERALRALSGQDDAPEIVLSGDRQRELFLTNDPDQIAHVARRIVARDD
ncbi:MAG: hypothetical protein KAI47_09010 [Deltaproteobacteria bacterium]|nr:hypothetical protein [Deltaproteobacteria bacterium]